jgi:hypothetical protein
MRVPRAPRRPLGAITGRVLVAHSVGVVGAVVRPEFAVEGATVYSGDQRCRAARESKHPIRRVAHRSGVVGHPKRNRCQSSGRIMEW